MKTRYIYTVLMIFLFGTELFGQTAKRFTVSGYVTEKGSKELLIGTNVYIEGSNLGTTTNNYGYYALSLPPGTYRLVVSYVGYAPWVRDIVLENDITLNVALESSEMLSEVVVSAEKAVLASRVSQMSSIQLPVAQVLKLPALLGEKDVLKAIQLMPGVQSGSEGNSGLYVRGGGPDQNLLILDDAPVYNASHLFGFFSIFNGDAIKNVTLTKGGFPARYGGRLSSVLDMSMKDGNKEKFSGEAGIGLISSRLMLEAPIIKEKSSFIISGRRTYVDLLTRPMMPDEEKGGYYFYDFNAKVNYDIDHRNKLYLSGYFGKDKFNVSWKESNGDEGKGGLDWGNITGTLRWNRLFTDKIFANTALIFSDYTFSIGQEDKSTNGAYELDYRSGIKDLGIKYDMQIYVSPEYTLRTGVVSTKHDFRPSAVVVKDEAAARFDQKVQKIKTIESGIYIENELFLWERLRMNAGLRWSHYHHAKKDYSMFEPRLSASYTLASDWAAKASYASMNQYVHLLSTSGVGLPMDLWVPTTDLIAPQRSRQVAVGLAKDFIDKNLNFSAEGFYKKMDNIIGYAPGANFLLVTDDFDNISNFSWEENVIQGQGWSYGMELLLQRKVGRLSGWIGYTLSWTQHQFDEDNGGRKFYARHDRRHDISVVGIYNLSERITLSGTWVYGTGNAISLPSAKYDVNAVANGVVPEAMRWYQASAYDTKNDFRMRSYHRLDVGIQFHKRTKRNFQRTWDISVYNVYSRRNPFFYQISSKQVEQAGGGKVQKNILEQYSIFPIIPSVTYSLKF
ncbi:MAG: TonB-dependent receptor [Capnocytophaga sp.]|nr:TonB-dependent receptor [Capnocytophaga sp.]